MMVRPLMVLLVSMAWCNWSLIAVFVASTVFTYAAATRYLWRYATNDYFPAIPANYFGKISTTGTLLFTGGLVLMYILWVTEALVKRTA